MLQELNQLSFWSNFRVLHKEFPLLSKSEPICNHQEYFHDQKILIQQLNQDFQSDYSMRKKMLLKRFELTFQTMKKSNSKMQMRVHPAGTSFSGLKFRDSNVTSLSIPSSSSFCWWSSFCMSRELFMSPIKQHVAQVNKKVRKYKIRVSSGYRSMVTRMRLASQMAVSAPGLLYVDLAFSPLGFLRYLPW